MSNKITFFWSKKQEFSYKFFNWRCISYLLLYTYLIIEDVSVLA